MTYIAKRSFWRQAHSAPDESLLNDDEGIVFHDAFTNLYTDSSNLSCLFSLQVVGHLHGLKDNDGVAT